LKTLALPLLLTALLLGVRLAAPNDLKSGDQGKSAQYVLHAWNTGELVVPLEQGALLPTKPPLPTWLGLASSCVAGGPSDFAIRLPPVLAAFLLALVTGLLARRLGLPDPVPAISVLVVAGNYLFLKTATVVRPDMILALAILFSIYCAVRAIEGDGARWAVLAFLCGGLGVLAKGPVALLVAALAVLPWARLRPDRPPLGRLRPAVGIPLLLLIVAAWAVPAYLAHGDELYRVMVSDELARHAGGSGKPVYKYLLTFPGRFIPWVLFLPAGFVLAVRSRRTEPSWPLGLPFLWFVLCFIAFSLFGSKRVDYLLPIAPAGAILVAAVLARGGPSLRWLCAALAVVLILLLAVFLVLGPAGVGDLLPTHRPRMEMLRDVIVERRVLIAGATALCALLALAGYAAMRRGRPGLAATALFALYLTGTAAMFHGLPEVAAESTVTKSFARRALERREPGVPLLVYRTGAYSNAMLFYLGRAERPAGYAEIRRGVVLNPDGIHVITTEPGLKALRAKTFRVKVLLEQPGSRRSPAYYLLELR